MTSAVCVKCGGIKHGGFTTCGECGFLPASDLDLAYSLALTDHYFDQNKLQEISKGMKAGQPRPSLPPEQEEEFLKAVRDEQSRKILSAITSVKHDSREQRKVTKKETYLYGQLFALAKENLAAINKLTEGKLGMWGKARLQPRTNRISQVLLQLYGNKQKQGISTDDIAFDEIERDILFLYGKWGDISKDELEYLQSIMTTAHEVGP